MLNYNKIKTSLQATKICKFRTLSHVVVVVAIVVVVVVAIVVVVVDVCVFVVDPGEKWIGDEGVGEDEELLASGKAAPTPVNRRRGAGQGRADQSLV